MKEKIGRIVRRISEQRYAEALDELKPMVDQGDSEAVYLFAKLMMHGQGVPQDLVKARELLEVAVEKEVDDAPLTLAAACCRLAKKGELRDLDRVEEILGRYAGNPRIDGGLGRIAVDMGVAEAEMDRVRKRLRRAAEHGDAISQFYYGFLLADESPDNYSEAIRWCEIGIGQVARSALEELGQTRALKWEEEEKDEKEEKRDEEKEKEEILAAPKRKERLEFVAPISILKIIATIVLETIAYCHSQLLTGYRP